MSKARNLAAFISNPTIDASEIAQGAITTDKIADLNITYAKLHTDMDLSSKTVTFADNHISGNKIHGGVISDFASTGIDDNATSTSLTINSSGNVNVTGTITATSFIGDGSGLTGVTSYTDADTAAYLSANGYDTATNVIATITDSAPTTLDTLNELAAALGDDPNFATTVSNSIAGKVSKSGDTITGNLTISGNVGIGTSSPTSKLHVDAPSTTAPSLTWGAAAGQIFTNEDAEFAFGLDNTTPYAMYIQGRYIANTARDITINPLGGKVGIGTQSPTTKLDVNGDIKSTNILSNVKVGNSQSITFDRGAGDYSNYIRAANYPSQGYTTADDKYWIEYGTKGGHHFVVNTDGGNTTSENAYDDFTIWQGGVDVRRVFSVSNQGNVWARGVVQGAFKEFDTTLNTTIGASNTSITWSPSLPANAWVAMSVFISSMDSDQSDHFDIKIGPSADYGSTWGDTNPSVNVPYGFGILTHPGDLQSVAMGYYGMWDEVIAKTNGSGQLVFSIVGSNGGSGITVRTKGYWLP